MKRIIPFLLALILAVSALSACQKREDKQEVVPLIMESEHYTVRADMYQYFFAYVYADFMNQYGAYASAIGIDTTKPLRTQSCPAGQTEGYTWYDYFSDGALDMMQIYLNMAEYALSEGCTLDQADEQEIADTLSQVPEYAAKQEMSEQEYLHSQFGSYVTMDTLNECYRLFSLASKGHGKLYDSYAFTAEDYDAYTKSNPDKIYYADFLVLRVGKEAAEGADAATIAASLAENQARAQELQNGVASSEDFLARAEQYYRSIYQIVADGSEEADSEKGIYTETQLKNMVSSCKNEKTAYNTSSTAGQWLFADERVAGDQHMIADETTGCCEIYYVVNPIRRSEEKTVSVRHILLNTDNCETEEKAQARADELLAQWRAGEATEDSFGELAAQNSADTGTASVGGLCSDLNPGDTVTEFNDWCFDSARAEGDTGIVKTQFGYHIIYFVSRGLPGWQATADAALREAAFNEDSDKFAQEHPVTKHTDVISDLPDYIEESDDAQ